MQNETELKIMLENRYAINNLHPICGQEHLIEIKFYRVLFFCPERTKNRTRERILKQQALKTMILIRK